MVGTGDIYWPKQELVSPMDGNHRSSQEDHLILNYNNQYSQYSQYANGGYPSAHHHAYSSQTSPVNYDTSAKNTGSAFSFLSGSSARNALNYYPDPFSHVAIKSQNCLSDVMTNNKSGQISADHFAQFTSTTQAMRSHYVAAAGGFTNGSMPTMLSGDGGSGLRKDSNKNARY